MNPLGQKIQERPYKNDSVSATPSESCRQVHMCPRPEADEGNRNAMRCWSLAWGRLQRVVQKPDTCIPLSPKNAARLPECAGHG